MEFHFRFFFCCINLQLFSSLALTIHSDSKSMQANMMLAHCEIHNHHHICVCVTLPVRTFCTILNSFRMLNFDIDKFFHVHNSTAHILNCKIIEMKIVRLSSISQSNTVQSNVVCMWVYLITIWHENYEILLSKIHFAMFASVLDKRCVAWRTMTFCTTFLVS